MSLGGLAVVFGSELFGSSIEAISAKTALGISAVSEPEHFGYDTDARILLPGRAETALVMGTTITDRVTVIVDRRSQAEKAYYAERLSKLRCDQSGRVWAGASGRHVHVLQVREERNGVSGNV
jgi:hypothetical protein